jgi:hypothetical protein
MKQFEVTFTRTLIHEVVIEAQSLEAARRVADEREKELGIDDFETVTTTYDLRETEGDTGDEG